MIGRYLFLSRAIMACVMAVALNAVAAGDQAERHYRDAVTRYDKRDDAGAVIQLRNALQADPGHIASHLLLGKSLLRLGQLPAAEVALREAIKRGVSMAEVAPYLGQIYLERRQPNLLLDQFQPGVLPPAARAEILALRGIAHAQMGNWRIAQRSFEDGRNADPQSAAPLIAEVPLLLARGDLETARHRAARAVGVAPTNALAWSSQGAVFIAGGESKAAVGAYERALAIDPRLAEARLARAGVLMELGRDDDARKDLAYLEQEKLVNPRAAYMRALLAGKTGDAAAQKAALTQTVQMIDALPTDALRLQEPLLMTGALAHYGLKNLQKAREYLEVLSVVTGRPLVPRKFLAAISIELGDFTLAEQTLESLRGIAPDDPQVDVMLGTVYQAQQKYREAADAFERAAARGGEPVALRELGMVQLALGRDKQGVASLEKAFAASPGDLRSGTELAMTFVRQGQPARATRILEEIVKRNPANLAMLNLLGTVKKVADDKKGAREAYAAVLAKDANFRPAILNLARLDLAEQKFEDARKRLQDLLARSRDDPDASFELGQVERAAGRTADAMRLLRRAHDLKPQDSRAGFALIELLIEKGRPGEALVLAKEVVQRFPENVAALMAFGKSQVAIGDTANAKDAFQKASVQAGVNAALQVEIGRQQLAADNPAGAVACALKALQANPLHAPALALQVQAEAARGDDKAADAALAAMTKAHPKEVLTFLTRANLAMSRGQYAQALVAYREVHARQPSTLSVLNMVRALRGKGEPAGAITVLEGWLRTRDRDATAVKALAETQADLQLFAAARDTYQRALKLEPEEPLTLNNLANVLLALKDPTALSTAQRALKQRPEDPDVIDTVGWILVQSGDLQGGIKHLREARLRSPANPEIRYHLAYALIKAGGAAEARAEIASGLKAQPGPRLKEQLEQLGAALPK